MATVAQLKAVVTADVSGLEAGLRRGGKAVNDFARGAREGGARAAKDLSAALSKIEVDKLRSAGQGLTLGLTTPLLAAGGAAIKFASDLEESMSKADVVFGRSASSIKAWSRDAAVALGSSRGDAVESAATFGNLFVSMGLTGEKAAEMSKKLVLLGADLASLNNANVGETITALRAGLVGETEPMRRFGVNIDAAAVSAEALRLGLVRSTKEGLDPAMKAQAAYSLILKQTKTAQGNYALTADGFANSLRTAQAELKDTAAALGKELLPAAKDALKTGRDFLKFYNELPPDLRKLILGGAIAGAVAGPALQGIAGAVGLFKALGGGAAGAGAGGAAAGAAAAGAGGAAAAGGTAAAGAAASIFSRKDLALLALKGAFKARMSGPAALGSTLARTPVLAAGAVGVGIGSLIWDNEVARFDRQAAATDAERQELLGGSERLRKIEELKRRRRTVAELAGRDPRFKATLADVEQQLAAARAGTDLKATAPAKKEVFNDPEDVLKARDATFAAEKARAGVLLAAGDEETKAAQEAAALIPILKRQREDLLKRAQELKPQVGEDAKKQIEYQNLLADIAQVEEEAARLQAAAIKERKEREKKLLETGRDLRSAAFEGRRQALQAGLAGAPEGQKAQLAAGSMLGLISGRQQELVAEAQTLNAAARTDPEAQKRLLELQREWWDLQADANSLRAAATKEQSDNAKKARQQEDKLFDAEVELREQQIAARLALVGDEEQARAALAFKIPHLNQLQADLLKGLQDLKPGTEEYVKQQEELWKVEEDRNRLMKAAAEEGKAGQKKALDAAKKAAADEAEVLELKSQLLMAQIGNNPFLNPRQRNALIIGAQVEQYRHAMTAVAGETEAERLKRLIGAEGLKGDILKAVGGGEGFARTAGGGMIPLFDPRAVFGASRELERIGAQAASIQPRAFPTVQKPAGMTQVVFNLPAGLDERQQEAFILNSLRRNRDRSNAMPRVE